MIQGVKQVLMIYVCIQWDMTTWNVHFVSRWEFECSKRHCMKFKITKDKNVQLNKMLLFCLAWFLLFIWPTITNCSSVTTAIYQTGTQSHYNVRPLNLKLCRSQKDSEKVRLKVESSWPIVRQKLFKLKWEGEQFFQANQKREKWTILCFGGKKRRSGSEYRLEQPHGTLAFEGAVSSLDFVYRKLLQLRQTPPPTQNWWNRPNGQHKLC